MLHANDVGCTAGDCYGTHRPSRPLVAYYGDRPIPVHQLKTLSVLTGKFTRLIATKRFAGPVEFVTVFDHCGTVSREELGTDLILVVCCRDRTFWLRVDFTTPPSKKCDRYWPGRLTVIDWHATPV